MLAELASLIAIFGRIWDAIKSVIGPILSKYSRPNLGLVDRFFLGEQGVRSAGTIRLFLQNTGKATAKDILVKLRVFQPQDASPGHKLFFNDDIGSLESYRKPSWLEFDRLKPQVYQFRLRSEIFVNTGVEGALEIAHFIVFTVEDTPPGDLDHKVEWTIHCADNPLTTGTITRKGIDLKKELLKHEYESGHIIGYEIPSGRLPSPPENDSE